MVERLIQEHKTGHKSSVSPPARVPPSSARCSSSASRSSWLSTSARKRRTSLTQPPPRRSTGVATRSASSRCSSVRCSSRRRAHAAACSGACSSIVSKSRARSSSSKWARSGPAQRVEARRHHVGTAPGAGRAADERSLDLVEKRPKYDLLPDGVAGDGGNRGRVGHGSPPHPATKVGAPGRWRQRFFG